ncbi:hypothetical protein GCM10027062_28010 [Nocardioides hungaricus]
MRSTRLTLAVTALATVLALSACSGDDEPTGNADPSPTAEPTEGAKVFERKCEVSVEVTGAVEVSWSGAGRSSNEAGPTSYTSADGKDRIIAYAATDDLATNANVTIGGATYTTTSPDGLDIAADGTSATVDAATTGTDGDGPRVMATFTCGKKAKG